MSIVKVENLGKYFPNEKGGVEVKAVDGISFQISRGEIFGFLGPNGAGKTTTARLLAGLLKPSFGRAEVAGLDVASESDEVRKRIGFLTENHGSYEDLTVQQNLEFFGGFYDIVGFGARIREVLDDFGLADRAGTKVGKLSKGLKQRVALARVLVHDPPVLFLDEPTAGLDPVAAVRVRETILDLKSNQRTIFVNSHNLDEVQKICDRVAIIDRGKLKRVGTPAGLSKDIWNAQELRCVLKPPVPESVAGEVSRVEGVRDVVLDGDTLLVHVVDVGEVTPEVARTLVESGAMILEISPERHSLEDVYLRLMDDGREVGA
ncbi:MAG: ABC transporter ATP-binding protein [Promethearchaeota archaeon]